MKKYGPQNITLLYDTYPQLMDNEYGECMNAVQQHLLNWNSPLSSNRNYYSVHYYTDLGYPNFCKSEADGQHVQIAMNLTELPLKLPISLCLPKECATKLDFDHLVSVLEASTNSLLEKLKQNVDLDTLAYSVPNNTQDTTLARQFTAIISSKTQV